jgi:long-subunit fatty acid transport protein
MKKVLVAATAVLFSFAVSAQTAPANSSKANNMKVAEKKEVHQKHEVNEKKEATISPTEKNQKSSRLTKHVSKPIAKESQPKNSTKK